MTLPNFLDIGPGRAGSSWLHEVLSSHPEVYMGSVKETEFFNTEYRRGLAFYESFFTDANGHKAIGEISNNYYLDAETAARIKKHLPNAKLLVHLRNPYELLRSFYDFGVRRGLVLPPLEAALEEPIGRLMGSGYERRAREGELNAADRVTLLDSVMLADRLEPFLAAFPAERVYPFVFDRMSAQHEQLAVEIFQFLEVDIGHRPGNLREVVNPTLTPRSRVLASLASGSAKQLRRLKLHWLLGRLHRSRTIKRVLFRRPPTSAAETIRASLPSHAVERIDEQMPRLSAMLPVLRSLW